MQISVSELAAKLIVASALSAGVGKGQTGAIPSAEPAKAAVEAASRFEVATIRPGDSSKCCAQTWGRQGRRLSTNNTSLRWLIRWAYGLNDKQIVGGPAWLDKDGYDVSGEIEGTRVPTDPEWKAAMQTLLADRFKLQFHHETRQMKAYALSVARGGAKLTKSDPAKNEAPMYGFSGAIGSTMQGQGQDVTLDDFMTEVQRLVLDRPLVNRTGVAGRYDLHLTFTREEPGSMGMMSLPENAAPNLITALDQQLGLKLEGVKGPVDVLVIDRAEAPSDN